MHIFDYSFLNNGMLPAEIVNLASSVSAFHTLASDRKTRFKSVYTELEKIARVASVKSSNAIEGIVTTDARINEIVNNDSAPLNHSEQEIAGYRDALDEIHRNHQEMSVNTATILHLHSMIMRYSSPTASDQFKREDNLIMEIDSEGRRKVRFKPVSAKETPDAIEQLLLAYIDARCQPNVNPLLLTACFIVDFLCIHPFDDGNGRVSRLLTILLLYKNDYDIGKYISIEEQINNFKDYYYQALYESSEDWHDNKNDYVPFMKFFLFNLYECYKELDKRFSSTNGKKLSKKSRIEETVMNSVLPMSKADICQALPDVSPSTVEAVIGKMVKTGAVRKIGSTRNARYVNAKHISE